MIITSYQKEVLKSSVPGIILLGCYFLIINLLPVNNIYISGLTLLVLSFTYLLIKSIREKKKPLIKQYFVSAITITIFFTIAYYLGGYGVVGMVMLILGVVLYKLFVRRSQMMKGMREVETMMFGKSLDKNNWVDEKPRLGKVKEQND